MALADILKKLEGVLPSDALASIASELETEVKSKEAEFTAAAEEKYGVKPSVVSDVENVVKDAVQVAAPAVESLLPPDIAALIRNQASQLAALQAQIDSLKAGAANQTTSVMGQGEPVPHTLFLDDGTVIKNHAGLATHVSIPVPATATSDATEVVKKVVAAYPA